MRPAYTGPYNLAGATLLEHLFNLLNGVDQASGSPQNERGQVCRWLRGASLLSFFNRDRRESFVNRSWALPNAVCFGLFPVTLLQPTGSFPKFKPAYDASVPIQENSAM